ncbi:MAG: LmeA family phospholipid-binding protein [Dermatophilaceae bacterium]
MSGLVRRVASWSWRPRVRRVLIPVVVVAVLVAAEVGGRWWAAERMREAFADGTRRVDRAEVDVDLGRWPVVVQALTGRLDRVELSATVSPYAIAGEGGDYEVVAEDVPVWGGTTSSVVGRHRVSQRSLEWYSPAGDSIRVEGDSVVVSGEFGLADPPPRSRYEIELGVVADDGTLKWIPESLRVDGQPVDVATLDETSLGGVGFIVVPDYEYRWCIEQGMPWGLDLESAKIDDGALVLTATGTDVGGPRRETCRETGDYWDPGPY